MRGRDDLSEFLPCTESVLSEMFQEVERDAPPRDPSPARTYRHAERATQCFRCSSLCQEKKDLIWPKGFYFSWTPVSHTMDQRRGQWPYLSQLFLNPNRKTANISWHYYLNEGEQNTIFMFLFPLLQVEIRTEPSSRIIVKIKWDDSYHLFVLVT